MGKKYTTDEIEVGGHMLDASMMTSLDTVVTDSSSYFTTSGGTLTGDLTVDGNAIASGIGIGTSTIYSNSVNLNNSGTLRIGNAEFLAKAGNDLSVYQGKMRVQQGGKVLVGVTVNQTQSKLTSRQNGSSIEFGHLNQGGKYYGTLGAMSSSGSPFIAFSADNSSANTFTTRGAKGFVISQDTNISGDLIFSSVPLVNTANQELAEKIRITSAGNIGIGTNNPGTKLHIGGGIITVNDGTGITYYEGTKINSYDANGYDIIGREGLTFSTVSADKDIILSPTGNVGVGTTNPNAKLKVAGDINASGFMNEEGGNKNRLLLPKGASYNGSGSQAGAIKITLPVLWTNTMMRIKIKVFDYSTGESFDVAVGGYNYVGSGSGGSWVNTSAWISSQSDKDRNFTVRFGNDGSKAIVYIGELNSYWAYLKVNVIDVELNHNNTVNDWSTTSWAIGLESSSFQNVSRTHSNCQVNNWKRSGQDVYYASGTGNVGIGTTAPSQKLHVSDGGIRVEKYATGLGGFVSVGNATETAGNYSAYFFGNTALDNSYFKGGIAYETLSSTNGRGDMHFLQNSVANSTNADISHSVMTILNSGNVGIGTTSPAVNFQVGDGTTDTTSRFYHNDNTFTELNGYGIYMSRGSSYIRPVNNNAQNLFIGHTGNTWNEIAQNANTHIFRKSANEFMRITSGGNVGIGTTSPGFALDVHGDSTAGVLSVKNAANGRDTFRSENATGTRTVNIGNDGSGHGIILIRNSSGTTTNYISGSGNSYFNGGNVGIGTTSPTGKLDVREANVTISTSNSMSDGIRGLKIEGTNAGVELAGSGDDWWVSALGSGLSIYDTTANAYRLKILNNGNIGIGTTNPTDKLDVSGNIKLVNTQDYIKFANDFVTLKRDSDNSMLFNAYAGFKFFDTQASSERMRITSSGNVGIGTTSPSQKLDVNGNAYISGQAQASTAVIKTYSGHAMFGSNSTAEPIALGRDAANLDLVVATNGNVGIGTTSPGYTLDVNGGLHSTNINIADGIYHEGDTNTYMQFHANDQWRVVTNGTERLEVNNTQVTVANNLQVGGSIYASQYIYHTGDTNTYMRFPSNDTISWNTAGSERMRINSSGNIGIGTTAPSYRLHVTGTTYANGSVIGSSDLWLRDQSSAYSTELKMQNNTHTIGIDYQNNETLRFITRSGVTTVPITFAMRTGTINAANFTQTSDERLKTKISDLSCDNIDVSWKSFEMKDNEGEYRTGVVAQELEQKHPEFVNTNDEGFKSVKYIDLLIAKIAELEARLEKLEK